MRKKTFDRMVKRIHDMNLGVLSTTIQILKLKPTEEQQYYNPLLKEYYNSPEQEEEKWEVIVETSGIIDAFKESENWHEVGTIGAHDYKVSINDNLEFDFDNITNYRLKRLDNNKLYEIIFYREFIGEVHIGIRPLMNQ